MAEVDTTQSEVPDVLGPDLRIVFVGINPGRVSAAAGAHFANPRNDFWRLLHASKLTSRLYAQQAQFAPRRLRGLRRAARGHRARAPSRVARLRRQGGVSRRIWRAARPRSPGEDARQI